MKYLKLGFQMAAHNPWLNMLLVAQLAVSMIMVNFIFLIIDQYTVYPRMAGELAQKKGIYYMVAPMLPMMPGEGYDKAVAHYEKVVTDLPGERAIWKIRNVGVTQKLVVPAAREYGIKGSNGRRVLVANDMRIFPDELLQSLNIPLAEGSWDALQPREGVIPVVVPQHLGNTYQVGQTYEVMITTDMEKKTKTPVQVEVVGKLPPSGEILQLGYGQGDGKFDMRNMYEPLDELTALPSFITTDSAAKAVEPYVFGTSGNWMVVFDQNISQEQFDANLTTLRQNGFAAPFSRIWADTWDTIWLLMSPKIPAIVCALLVAVIGLISFTALNTQRSLYTYAVYSLCGARWRDCLRVSLAYIAWLCGAAVIAYVAVVMAYNAFGDQVQSFLNWTGLPIGTLDGWSLLTMALVLPLTAAIAMILPAVTLRRTGLLEQIRTDET